MKTLLPRSVLSSLNCRRAEISDGVSEKEDGDADGGEDDGHPADPQRLARALLGAEEPPAVQAGRRAEPVKVDPSSIWHFRVWLYRFSFCDCEMVKSQPAWLFLTDRNFFFSVFFFFFFYNKLFSQNDKNLTRPL